MGKELSVCECVKGRNLALSELGDGEEERAYLKGH